NRSVFYDDDDDEYTIQYRKYLESSSNAITPVLPIEEPDNSLSMRDEHLSTILETESDKVTKSSVEDLVPIPNSSIETSLKIPVRIMKAPTLRGLARSFLLRASAATFSFIRMYCRVSGNSSHELSDVESRMLSPSPSASL
ncbi:hypothetical protein Tco_1199407, partial [Tanacetum coccineum]